MLRRRIATFGHAEDPMDIWAELGVARPRRCRCWKRLPLLRWPSLRIPFKA
jgi:malonate decarboxylase beta subunit